MQLDGNNKFSILISIENWPIIFCFMPFNEHRSKVIMILILGSALLHDRIAKHLREKIIENCFHLLLGIFSLLQCLIKFWLHDLLLGLEFLRSSS